MAQIIVQTTMLKISKVAFNSLVKTATPMVIRANNYSVDRKEKKIAKQVFISQSSDIFSNLALEDWMYKNFDFSKHHVLLLWRNDPCVVIGRHQNPWLEANVSGGGDVTLARRNSGGGTVYHDRGNLNLTFFTPRERYNRKNNLELIGRALFREWGLATEINKREDIVVKGNHKISGTASKLGRPNAYHHCTLLVDVNKSNLGQALQKQDTGIVTNATRSIPSPVLNLSDVNPAVKLEKLLAAVGWEYLRTHALTMQDGGKELIAQQYGFTMINPVEYYFPGLDAIRDQFVSWDWRFGKTPKFNVSRSFAVSRNLAAGGDDEEGTNPELAVSLQVCGGVVEDATIKIPSGMMPETGFPMDPNLVNLRGSRFTGHTMGNLGRSLAHATSRRGERLEPPPHSAAMRQVVKNV